MIEVWLRATRTTSNSGRPKPEERSMATSSTPAPAATRCSAPLFCWNTRRRKWSPNAFGADPFRDMRRLQNELTRMAKEALQGQQSTRLSTPTPSGWRSYHRELPGVKSEDVEVSVHRDAVTLSGGAANGRWEAKGYHRRERRQGRFVGTLSLPFMVDPNGTEAAMNNGVLRLELPRAEEDNPRRVKVKAR